MLLYFEELHSRGIRRFLPQGRMRGARPCQAGCQQARALVLLRALQVALACGADQHAISVRITADKCDALANFEFAHLAAGVIWARRAWARVSSRAFSVSLQVLLGDIMGFTGCLSPVQRVCFALSQCAYPVHQVSSSQSILTCAAHNSRTQGLCSSPRENGAVRYLQSHALRALRTIARHEHGS